MATENGKKAVKAGFAYTVGNIFIKGINFLTLPIFSRILTTEEFGIYNVFLSYEAVLYVVVGFAFHSSMRSAKIEYKERIDDYTSSISLVYIINLCILMLFATLISGPLSRLIAFSKPVLLMLVLYSFSSAILTFYNERIALDYSYKKYLIISFLCSLGNVAISLFLILFVFKSNKDIGRILGVTITGVILSVYILLSIYKRVRPKYNHEYWKFAFKYSLPIVPHGIAQVLLAQYDRIMIRDIIGNSAAGIFSLAGNIKLILTIVTASISTSWSTWFYEEIEKGNHKIIKKRAKTISWIFVIFTIGLMAISSELVDLLGGAKYYDAKLVAVPIIIDAFVLFLYNIIVPAEYYKKKTLYIMIGTIIAAILDVILNYIYIRKYGFIAAAYTTLFAYICYLLLHIIISRKLIGFYILSLSQLLIMTVLIVMCGAFDLIYKDFCIYRWLLCMLVISIVLFAIWKTDKYEIINFIKKRKGEKNGNEV